MNAHPSRPLLPSILALSALLSAAVFAAQAPAGAPPDPVVQLSPFEVKADTNGYLTAETSTGTRYAAPISELPIAVNIVSAEFMEEFHTLDLSGMAALAYTSSFANEASEVSTGAIVLRGIRGFAVYKNGIREGGVFGPASIDRIEVLKGASASIYGQAEPSGMVNRVTKEGRPNAFQALTLDLGQGNYSRVMADVNQPVNTRLLTRFAGSYEYSEQFQKHFAKFARKNFYGSATYNISKTSVFTAHAEYVKFRSYAQGAGGAPFVVSPATLNGVNTTQTVGMLGVGKWRIGDTERLNINGPYIFNEVEYTQVDAKYSNKINDWLSFQLLGNHWERNQHNNSTEVTGGTYNSATGILAGTQGVRRAPGWQTQWNVRADVLAEFSTGPVAHRMLLSADWICTPSYAYAVRSNLPGYTIPLQNYLVGGPYADPRFEPNYAHYNPGDRSVWNVNVSNGKNRTIDQGLGFAEQAILLKRHLFLSGGFRYEKLYFTQIDFLNPLRPSNSAVTIPAGQLVQYPKVNANTFQTGAVYKIGAQLSAFANYSSAFVPQASNPPLDADGNPLPPVKGNSKDLGLKADFPAQRLSFTTAIYDTLRTNLARTALNAAGQQIQVSGILPGTLRNYSLAADVRSYGAEFDGNWVVNGSLNLFGGVSWNHVRYVKIPNATEQYLLGITPDSTPPWTANAGGTYRFERGTLKGFNVRVGGRFRDAGLVNTSTASIYGNSGVKGPPVVLGGQPFDTYYFKNRSYTIIDVGLGYRWRRANFDHRVTLNLSNVTDQHQVVGNQIQMGSAANISYSLKH